jgi:beta,beta-carotene 9',10'-dioxygenase
VVAEHRVPPFVVFHHANAHRDGDELVVDLLAFDSPSVLNGMYLDRLRDTAPTSGSGGELRRYRLPLDSGDPTGKTVATNLALPRIRPDRTGRPYRYVYAQDSRAAGPPRGIARVDVETGERRTWWTDAGYPGEPVFVPAPGDDAPEDGVVLVETLVPDRDRSELVVVAADSMTERARVAAPHRIPFGFHGQYVSRGDRGGCDKHNH